MWQRGASERASEARERDAPRCHRRPAYVRVLDEPGEACGHPGRLTYTSLRPCPWCRPRGWRSWRRGAGERASEARERVAPRCHRCASAVPPRRVPAPGSASSTSSSTLVSMLMPLMGYAPGTPSIGSRSWARPCQPARSLPAGCRRAGQRAASAVLHSGASGVPQEPGIYLFGFDNLVWYMMGILRSWFSWQGQSLCPEGRGFETRPGPSAPAPAPASAAAGHGSRTRHRTAAPELRSHGQRLAGQHSFAAAALWRWRSSELDRPLRFKVAAHLAYSNNCRFGSRAVNIVDYVLQTLLGKIWLEVR